MVMAKALSATLNSKFCAVSFGFLWRVHRRAGSMNTSFEIMSYAMNNTYLRGEPDIERLVGCLDTRRKQPEEQNHRGQQVGNFFL